MNILAVVVNLKPESHAEGLAAMKTMQAATRQEAGCHDYTFYADMDDPNRFFLFEKWESQSHLDAHVETAHMAAFKKTLAEVLSEPTQISRFVVTDSEAK